MTEISTLHNERSHEKIMASYFCSLNLVAYPIDDIKQNKERNENAEGDQIYNMNRWHIRNNLYVLSILYLSYFLFQKRTSERGGRIFFASYFSSSKHSRAGKWCFSRDIMMQFCLNRRSRHSAQKHDKRKLDQCRYHKHQRAEQINTQCR